MGENMVGKKYTWQLIIAFKRTACRRSAEYRAADKANVKLYIQNRTQCVNTRALNLFEHVVATDVNRQVRVHTRQVKGRLPAGGGGGRQAA
jgi:hypothetical protein